MLTLKRKRRPTLFKYAAGDQVTGATFTRGSTATYLDAAGVVQTAAINTLRDGHYIGGVRTTLLEDTRTNHFLNSGAPATQTSASLSTGSYTLWMVGTGSVAVAGTTATITGAGTATAGSPVTFTVTVAGTVTYTVTGSPTRVQAENGAFASSYIPTTGTAVTRSADMYTLPWGALANPSAMTVYAKFVEMGTAQLGAKRLFQLATGNTNPQFAVSSAGAVYGVTHLNGVSSVGPTVAVASPSLGNTVEIRAVLGDDGSIQLGQSINAAAEAVAGPSAALAFASSWGATPALYLNSGSAQNVGFNAFVALKGASGVRSLTEMRAR